MKLIDSHCHLDFEPLPEDIEGILCRAHDAGVYKMVNIGTTLLRSRKSVELAEKFPNVWASVGIHPEDASEILDLEALITELEEMTKSDRVVAIGEIGLDYNEAHEPLAMDQRKRQKELFMAQLELAERLGLPVIIHVRDAWDDFFKIISNFDFQISNSPRGVVHCFTGDEKVAQKLVGLGFYLGFTGFITFGQEKFNHIRGAVKVAPLDNILIETDAPFLAPDPYRGKTNEPAYVVEVARKIADLKEVSLEEVAEITTKNAEKLFNINSL